MIRNTPRGYTLPELMVAGALFIGLATMAAFGLKMGIDAQDMSNRVREADIARGDALNRLTDELRTAAPLPVLGLGSSQVPSGVLYPDQYGNGSPFGGFYSHGVTATNTYQVRNRVIFSRPSKTAGGMFTPSALTDYVYVEWVIPEQAKNQIWRRVHASNAASPGHGMSAGKWLIKPQYFLAASGVSGSKAEDWLIARLPGANDTFELTLETARYVDPNTNQVAAESGFNTLYDRHLFKVYLKTTTVARSNPNKKTERTQESQVRVQAGE